MAGWVVAWRMAAMVKGDENQWMEFLDALAKVMAKFQNDQEFSMEDAFESLKLFKEHIDSEILEFAHDTISEIDGFPKGYSEVRMLAETKVSKGEFKKYMME